MRASAVSAPSSQQRSRSPRRRLGPVRVLVAGSLLLLATGTSPQVQELRRGINYAFSPVQGVLADGARSVGSMFAAFTEIDQLRRDRVTLQARVQELEQRLAQVDVVRAENAK